MRTSQWWGAIVSLAVFSALAGPAQAKVVFTGYGDFRLTPQGSIKIGAPAGLLPGLTRSSLESRGAAIDAVGLFATTDLSEKTRLLLDVTYRDIGLNARTIRLQYAYLEHEEWGTRFRAGKLMLPFGYYNENRFYPFHRFSVTGPTFNSGILGLPIADIGVSARKPFELGEAWLGADLYAVNGYGPVPGSTVSFRNASVPGGLSISNNVAGANSNHHLSYGGRLSLGHTGLPDSEAGLSYYRGSWDPEGNRLFQMGGAHAKLAWAGVDLLGEYLLMKVERDEGMLASFNTQRWRTDGFFVEAAYTRLSIRDRALTPWLRFENTRSQGDGGGSGVEKMIGYAGGLALQATSAIRLKLEALSLDYQVPVKGGVLDLYAYILTLGLVVSF